MIDFLDELRGDPLTEEEINLYNELRKERDELSK